MTQGPRFAKTSGGVTGSDTVSLGATLRAAFPGAQTTFVGHESKLSGGMYGDLQRVVTTLMFDVQGTPDEVQGNASLTNHFGIGKAHPWMDVTWQSESPYNSAYVVGIKIEPISHGVRQADGADYAYEWCRVTVTYQQRPCPWGGFEQRSRTSTVVQNEWYTHPVVVEGPPEPVKFLSGSEQPIPILKQVTIVTRRWPKVKRTASQIDDLHKHVNTLNPDNFLNHPAEVWMLTDVDDTLLYATGTITGDSSPEGMYDITLGFRSDPYRLHQWWWPVKDPVTLLPRNPADLSYDELHDKRRIYGKCTTDFAELLPVDSTLCLPPAGADYYTHSA